MPEIDEFREELESTSAALEEEAQNIVQTSSLLTDNLVKANRIVWRMLGFIWAVMLCLLITYVIILPNTLFYTESGNYDRPLINITASSRQDSNKFSPLYSSLDPSEYFPKLLDRIRQAQLEKNIDLFLSAYSPGFPQIEKKREKVLKIWQTYDFLEIRYLIDDFRQKDASTFSAKVTWNIKTQNIDTNEIKTSLKSYHVFFSKGSGKWLIQDLEALADHE
jgi:hypothetical protein